MERLEEGKGKNQMKLGQKMMMWTVNRWTVNMWTVNMLATM